MVHPTVKKSRSDLGTNGSRLRREGQPGILNQKGSGESGSKHGYHRLQRLFPFLDINALY